MRDAPKITGSRFNPDFNMRTTLDIAEDVLFAAKDLAREQKVSVGTMLSTLARSGLTQPKASRKERPGPTAAKLERFGIVPLPLRGGRVTNEMIDKLRELEGI